MPDGTDSDFVAMLRAVGHDMPPERIEAARPLLRAMAEVARRLELLDLNEPPA